MSALSTVCGYLAEGIEVEDTFAEAFGMTAARLIVTAETAAWARIAGQTATGYATSVIACDAEAGVERELEPDQTPDGRPGVRLLIFALSRDALEKALVKRVGQCVMTCPTTACYNDWPLDDRAIVVGGKLRYFGDGWQIAKLVGERRFWRMPTMDGEFACEERFGTLKGVAGGNLLFQGTTPTGTLEAATRAVAAIRAQCEDVILPFPGGIARSGSKVGSKYQMLRASVNDAYAPTLRGLVASALPESVQCVYELVIDGLSFDAVAQAMRVGLTQPDFRGLGLARVSAGNYGGKLGPYHFHLRDLLNPP
ncbi:formylmethanofuran-tetrahydromethanopterin formyltransferase [Isosphaera pallida ATCC 43644]|uniref:Formylmethanofuran--tetrahydromethanopterin formyltransferase n=1 Tax=Isosphaera pallida (strain ATCC 43644 / DSM 9630 / IS1B) TaxID=575540 RepID=E8QZI9_ISOPI|nr:formylmethanofuran--tetrahydromethanopterin N-formyltransferase [Isosphaera pallida]ADV61116.1 formylmethanofuran-tetrahydromethanopterin formyltransferase [Isosphaera pallida ATCC 43644]